MLRGILWLRSHRLYFLKLPHSRVVMLNLKLLLGSGGDLLSYKSKIIDYRVLIVGRP